VLAIAGGDSNTCAIINGAAKCWGYGADGELGNNAYADSPSPVSVSNITGGGIAIAAHGVPYSPTAFPSQTCALVNAAVQCWGNNQNGQLGNNSTTASPAPVLVLAFP
jgi:hypothetical protein